MKTVEMRYGVTFGKCDSSDWIDYEIELNDEEEKAYDYAVENEIPLEDIPELKDALARVMKKSNRWKTRMVSTWKMSMLWNARVLRQWMRMS